MSEASRDSEMSIDPKTRRHRIIQNCLLTFISTMLTWACVTFVEALAKIARIDERTLKTDIAVEGMYRAKDAQRDVAEMTARIESAEVKVERIDARVRAIELDHIRGKR